MALPPAYVRQRVCGKVCVGLVGWEGEGGGYLDRAIEDEQRIADLHRLVRRQAVREQFAQLRLPLDVQTAELVEGGAPQVGGVKLVAEAGRAGALQRVNLLTSLRPCHRPCA